MFKNYGLTGKTVMVRRKDKHTPAFPWHGIAVPVLILEERTGYLVGKVLPHYSPEGIGLSKPYRINMNKFDIEKGLFIISVA